MTESLLLVERGSQVSRLEGRSLMGRSNYLLVVRPNADTESPKNHLLGANQRTTSQVSVRKR